MSSNASANPILNNNERNLIRGRDLRFKHCSDSNIDLIDNQELESFLDNHELDDDFFLLLLEFRKRKALENKLKELQKKKDKMDGILRDIQAQHQRDSRDSRFKTNRHSFNSHRHQTRYEADGSEEDEIRLKSAYLKANSFSNSQDRRNVFSSKWKELEQAELKLKQVENLVKLIQEQESEESLLFKDCVNQYVSNNETNNIDKNLSSENHRADRSFFYQKQSLKESKNNTCDSKRRLNLNTSRNSTQESQYSNNSTAFSLTNNCPQFNFNSTESTTNDSSSAENDSLEEISQQLRERFLESMQVNFDSMKYVLENESFNLNQPLSNQQFFYLMLTQNYQILQQQHMLLYWLQRTRPCLNLCCNPEADENLANSLPNWNTALNSSSFSSSFTMQPRNQRKKVMQSFSHFQDVQDTTTLNNKVAPGERANNYWDNFKSNSRQNQLSLTTSGFRTANISKSNENTICSNQVNEVNHNYSSTLSKSVDGSHQDASLTPVNQANSSKSFSQSKKPAFVNLHPIDISQEKIKNTTLMDSSRCSAQGSDELNTISSKVGKYFSNDKRQINNANIGTIGVASGPANSSVKMSLDRGTGSGTVNASDLILNRGLSGNVILPSSIPISKIKSSNISMVEEHFASQELPNGIDNSLDLVASSIHHSNTRHHQVPLHISPSTGAIKKKLRNPDVTETTSFKQEKKEELNRLTILETIRPLMAAEGRSYEALSLSNNSQSFTSIPIVKVASQPMLIFRKRPPTTGATSRDENDPQTLSSSVNSTDDDLIEADQATNETISELDPLTSSVNNGLGLISPNHNPEIANITDSASVEVECNQSLKKNENEDVEEDEEEWEGEGEDEREEEEKIREERKESEVNVPPANKSGIRVSGDGEQGL